MANNFIALDYSAVRKALNEEFSATMELIRNGETHLDNLAEWFTEADRVFWKVMKNGPKIEIVRCRECRYSRELDRNDREENRYGDDCIWCTNHCEGMLEDGFCSEGERR